MKRKRLMGRFCRLTVLSLFVLSASAGAACAWSNVSWPLWMVLVQGKGVHLSYEEIYASVGQPEFIRHDDLTKTEIHIYTIDHGYFGTGYAYGGEIHYRDKEGQKEIAGMRTLLSIPWEVLPPRFVQRFSADVYARGEYYVVLKHREYDDVYVIAMRHGDRSEIYTVDEDLFRTMAMIGDLPTLPEFLDVSDCSSGQGP